MSSSKLITHLPLSLSILYKLESLLSPPLLTRDASPINTESAKVTTSSIHTPKLGLTKKGENTLFVFLNLGYLSIVLSSSIYLSANFMISNKELWRPDSSNSRERKSRAQMLCKGKWGKSFSGEGGRKAVQMGRKE